MSKIVDPANLSSSTVVVDTSFLTISFIMGGTGPAQLGTAGVSLQALYSYLKQLWRDDVNYRKFPFPMLGITPEQFELIDGWDFGNNMTRRLVRDGGWLLRGADGAVKEMYCNISTLGTIDNPGSDTVYYQQAPSLPATWAAYPGSMNQAVKIYGDPTHGNFSYLNYMKVFLRVQGKSYDYYDLVKSQNIPALTYKRYVLPLGNSLDFKISSPDSVIASQSPYTGITVTYIQANVRGSWMAGREYAVNDVVQFSGRWYKCVSMHTSVDFGAEGAMWQSYFGERKVGSSWYAFTTILNGNGATAEQIYERVQYLLRQSSPIDTGMSVVGNTTESTVYFVGQTLYTYKGVFIDHFAPADLNRIVFKDWNDAAVAYPYTASLMVVFNDNLLNDYKTSPIPARYKVYFTSNPAGAYGTRDAVVVQDSGGIPMEGEITAEISNRGFVTYTFDYDGNVQGGRLPSTDCDITVVAVGRNLAQYIVQSGQITRSTSNVVQMSSLPERNY